MSAILAVADIAPIWSLPSRGPGAVMYLLAAFAFGYSLGAIPFGKIFTRWAGLGDIRDIGSGNIGATNVLRTGNKKLAFLTLLFDAGKGAVAAFVVLGVTYALVPSIRPAGAEMLMAAAALGAFVGHIFPVGLGFKGGKGVATFFGTMFALNWIAALAAGATWLAAAFGTRFSSAGALAAVIVAPIVAFALGDPIVGAVAIFFALMVYWSHRENIRRLLSGTEPKIGAKKTA